MIRMLVSLSQFVEAKRSDTSSRSPRPAQRVAKDASPPKKPSIPKSSKTERELAIKKQQSRQKAAKTREKKAREKQRAGLDQARADRLAKRAEVKQLVAKRTGTEKPAGLGSIPAQIAHCMMALHVKRRKSKTAAWNICRWAMTKHGYLDGPYRINTKLPKAVKQTSKGTRRSFQHGMEKGPLGGGVSGSGATKFKRFVTMFRTLEPKIVPK